MSADVDHVATIEPCPTSVGGKAIARWRATCSCGWSGPQPRATKDAAKAEAVWHATHQGEGEAA